MSRAVQFTVRGILLGLLAFAAWLGWMFGGMAIFGAEAFPVLLIAWFFAMAGRIFGLFAGLG